MSLTIHFPDASDQTLNNMEGFLDNKDVSESVTTFNSWFRQHPILHQIQRSIEDLLQFRDANIKSSIVFMYMVSPSNDTIQYPSAEIKAYYNVNRLRYSKTVIPPGQPMNLKIDQYNHKCNITWSAPLFGASFIEHYMILVRERGQRFGEEPIEYTYQTKGSEMQFTMVTPDNTVPFDVHVYGMCNVGRTASSEILHHQRCRGQTCRWI